MFIEFQPKLRRGCQAGYLAVAVTLQILAADIIVKLRSKSRLGEGQVRVRKVRVRSESCKLK